MSRTEQRAGSSREVVGVDLQHPVASTSAELQDDSVVPGDALAAASPARPQCYQARRQQELFRGPKKASEHAEHARPRCVQGREVEEIGRHVRSGLNRRARAWPQSASTRPNARSRRRHSKRKMLKQEGLNGQAGTIAKRFCDVGRRSGAGREAPTQDSCSSSRSPCRGARD